MGLCLVLLLHKSDVWMGGVQPNLQQLGIRWPRLRNWLYDLTWDAGRGGSVRGP